MRKPFDALERPTRYLFFTGKGGVGKTSHACAAAIALADAGRRVLLVSTDPASNLDQVFGVSIGREPTPIAEVPGLAASRWLVLSIPVLMPPREPERLATAMLRAIELWGHEPNETGAAYARGLTAKSNALP